ncbi:MAG: Cytochrome c oxidase (cbb3-type) subunit CcoP [Cytophagales bacterium]|jgi:cytochrome c oxidase cbb3-type subunit 3|nr:c-type cytochrome [Bacteroidota bacterium]MBS1980413.1 c-type cytochrome [Bacteroidota bacterium]WHZ07727.1 MAG: Cytochrome c oxidase (cbb3-type) subunit CcoP [Cytophagales bacterium]
MKKIISVIMFLLASVSGFAQEAAKKTFWEDPFNSPMLPYYATVAFIGIVFFLIIIVLVILIRTLNLFIERVELQRAKLTGKEYVPSPSWWEKFSQKLNDSVPVEQEKDIELEHDYDGIRELDNHLPPWWKWLFYGCIVWAVVYFFIYHVSDSLPLMKQEYDTEVAQAKSSQQKASAAQPQNAIDENTLVYTKDEKIIERGKEVFARNACGSCHANDGGGNTIGPNLTDSYWIHGGGIKNVFSTIKNGVVEKGMPAWGKAMSINDVRDVTFFVMSLQGSKPAAPKAPQGELYKPAPEKSDSTKTSAPVK